MYEKITLPNGLRVLYENIPHVRSVAMGVWVATGSRYEKASQSGASHYIEHMLFKGTDTKTAAQLAEEMDEIGGQINAFTTKECTCFHGRVLDTHLDRFTDMLWDMFSNSRFGEEDVQSERGIIFEEIDMYRDTPDDLTTEKLFGGVFKGSSLARPILGSKKTLSTFTGQWLREYKNEHYTAEATVVTLSGSFTQQNIDHIVSLFSQVPSGEKKKVPKAEYKSAFVTTKKSIEQNHITLGFPSLATGDDRRFAMQVMNGILGGGMSSRLFQTLREKHGLCYSVFAFPSAYAGVGAYSVYTALSSDIEEKALSVIMQELSSLRDDGVTQAELDRSREQLKASLLMALESTSARMNRLGNSELSLGCVTPIDDVIKAYDSVTRDDILDLARYIFDFDRISISVVGKCAPADEYRRMLGV